MRLWSIHPKHLDTKGLLALWREGLLALSVLQGQTKGYTRHPQLERFRKCAHPVPALQAFLTEVQRDATRRGYRFNAEKIGEPTANFEGTNKITVTTAQIQFETTHLMKKLRARSPKIAEELAESEVLLNPVFTAIPGPIEPWERP
jgi:hypothetical protein